jgi:hypothetical protein
MSSPLDPFSVPVTNPTTLLGVSKAAGLAAGQAALGAVVAAATNAAKPGGQTTEFKAVVGGVALVAVTAALHVASVIPGPWMLPAIAISAAVMTGSYVFSRGNVKAAALTTAAAVLQALAQAPAPTPAQPPAGP